MIELPKSLTHGLWIVYDGECPYCRRYAHYVRLKETVGQVHLVNAREPHEAVDYLKEQQVDLHQGMVVIYQSQVYYAADAIHMLAMLSSSSTFFNRLNRLLFQSKTVACLLYPILKACRSVTLKVLGIPPIR